MEYTDLEGRIKQLRCLLNAAKESEQLGMVVYYQMLMEQIMISPIARFD